MKSRVGSSPSPGREQKAHEPLRRRADAHVARAPAKFPLESVADALDWISDSFFAIDREWRFTYVNKKAAQSLNRRPEDLLGKHVWAEFPEAIGTPRYKVYHRAMAEQTPMSLEDYHLPLKRWFDIRIFPSPDGLSIYVRDTTERREVQEALRQSEERLRLALDAARMGTFDWDVVHNHIVWSSGHEVLFGFAPGEFGGTYEAFADRVHQADLPGVNAEVARCLAARAPFAHEFRVVWPDGSEHWIAGRGEFTFDADGQAQRMRGVVLDVTERKQAEAALHERERQLSEAQRIAHIGSWSYDPSGRHTWSDEMYRIYGVAPDTPAPDVESFLGLIHPEDRSEMKAWIASYVAGDHAGELEFRAIRPDGTLRVIRARGEFQCDANGGPTHLTGTAQDVTDRVMARQELEASHETLRRFAASLITAREEERAKIAREIHDQCGQMLTGLKMDAVWLARRLPDHETALQKRIAAMAKLIDETVQTVRQIATELRPSVLDDLGLAAAVEWQAEQFTKRTGVPCEVRAHVREAELEPRVSIAVFRIFQESLTNVVRHSGATAVRATLEEAGGRLVFEVCDNGRGISDQDVLHPQSIGLVGMRERALLVDGELSVVSSPREGTTVRFRVPLRRTEGGE